MPAGLDEDRVDERAANAWRDAAERHRMILNTARDGIIGICRDGTVDGINPAVEEMFGIVEADMAGKDIRPLLGVPISKRRLLAFLRLVLRRGVPVKLEMTGRHSGGGTFLGEVVVTSFSLSTGVFFVAVVHDITERRRIEQMKDEFVATVSHELRTPLTSIAGSLGLLAGGAGGELPPGAARLISIAHSNSERLVRLINDILDIEKIESGKMNFEVQTIPLRGLLDQAVQANSGFAEKYGARLRLERGFDRAAITGDQDRLMQVLTNLLSNAIKFSPAGEEVLVSIARCDIGYRISVFNKGEGIPDEFKSRIFSKFAQADGSSSRQRGGTGLGLSIVKEIVTRLGGSVGFHSEAGEGATFFIDLPGAEDLPMPQAQVLLCTSTGSTASRNEAALREQGINCRVVEGTSELAELAQSASFSAVILDCSLTDDQRMEIIRFIRNDSNSIGTPVVVLSSEGELTDSRSQMMSILDLLHRPRLSAVVPEDSAEKGETLRILHVEDDRDILGLVKEAFRGEAGITPAETLAAAREALLHRRFDLVILDLLLGQDSGLELLPDFRKAYGSSVPIIIFSSQDATPEISKAVDAVLTKSRADLPELVATVRSLVG